MGGLFGGSQKTTSNSTTDTGPSKFQQPYLSSAFDAAQNIYDNSAGTPWYSGELYAGMSDGAKSDLSAQRDYATNTGLGTAQQLTSLGSDLSGYLSQAGSTIGDYLDLAKGDATASNITAASAYANNPYLNSQIDAVNRDVSRQLNEQTLPSIDRAAAGSGNINSSRAGVAQGIAERGAADRMADNAATIRSNAYNNGLSLAQQDRATELSALGNAASAYANLGSTGINALNAGASAGYGAYDTINSANASEQADRQGQDDAAYQSWAGNDSRASDLLQRYMNIIGSNQWGTYGTESGTSKTKSGGSLFNSLLSAGTLAASFI